MDNNQNTFSERITELLQRRPVILQLLRFAAIGFLNTGLSFIIANLISKYFGVTEGRKLGISSGIGFIFATIQSYYWNKYWAFGEQKTGLAQNFLRLVCVGLVGILALALVYVGSLFTAPYFYYFIALVIFAVSQLCVGLSFKLSGTAAQNPIAQFFVVSLIGFAINFFIASKFSEAVHLTANGDLNKNLALVAATCVSLVWNFIGYKLFVFKK